METKVKKTKSKLKTRPDNKDNYDAFGNKIFENEYTSPNYIINK